MRNSFFLLFLGLPLICWAQISTVEFTIPHDGQPGRGAYFRISLVEAEPKRDRVQRLDHKGDWETLFQGPLSNVDLPIGAQIQSVVLDSATSRAAGLMRKMDYDLSEPNSGSLRFRSNDSLVVLTEFGAAMLPWPGEVWEFRELDRDLDMHSGLSVAIVSVEGKTFAGTYMYINEEYNNPFLLLASFSEQPLGVRLEEGVIKIQSLGREIHPARMRPAERKKLPARLTAAPTSAQIMYEMIAQLDQREPMASAVNAEAQAKWAVRALLLDEFPILAIKEQSDGEVKTVFERLVRALAKLWLSGRIRDGATIQRVAEKRWSVLPANEKRSKCELALLKISGPGHHAMAYERGVALRSFNFLYRRIRR